jgi:hypothetical protein
VVETVDNEKHLALGVGIPAGLDCRSEGLRSGSESRPQGNNRFWHDLFKLAQKTPDDDVAEDTFVTIDVGGSEPAVVAGNDPARVSVGIGELFTQPGLPDSGFAGDDNAATSGCDGVNVLAHICGGTDPGHGECRFDRMSLGDCTEVGREPDLG